MNKMVELRIELLMASASSNLDLVIQCATLELVAEFMLALVRSVEWPERQSTLAEDTATELVVGLRSTIAF